MWPEDYWPDDYWTEDYWPKEGFIPPPSGGDANFDAGLGQIKTFSDAAELGGGGW